MQLALKTWDHALTSDRAILLISSLLFPLSYSKSLFQNQSGKLQPLSSEDRIEHSVGKSLGVRSEGQGGVIMDDGRRMRDNKR